MLGIIMSLSQSWLVSCTWAVNFGGLCSLKLLTTSWLVPCTWADYSDGPCSLKLLAILKSFPLAFVMVSALIPSTMAMSLTAYDFSISIPSRGKNTIIYKTQTSTDIGNQICINKIINNCREVLRFYNYHYYCKEAGTSNGSYAGKLASWFDWLNDWLIHLFSSLFIFL